MPHASKHRELIDQLTTVERWALKGLDANRDRPRVRVRPSDVEFIAGVVGQAARMLAETEQQIMGKASTAIKQAQAERDDFKGQLATATASLAALQTQFSDAKADAYDADDLAAIASELGTTDGTGSAKTPTPTPTLVIGGQAVDPVHTTNGIVTDVAGRTLYTHSGTDPVDATSWPTAGTYGTDAVYYFSGDTAPGQTNGTAAAGWSTIPAPTNA